MRVRDTGRHCPYCYEPIMEKQSMVKCDTGSVFRWVDMPHTCDEYRLLEQEELKTKEKRMTQVDNERLAEQDGRHASMESFEGAKPEDFCPYKFGTLYIKWLEGWYAEQTNRRIGHILTRTKVGLM